MVLLLTTTVLSIIVTIETCWLDHSDSADPDQTAKGIILSRSILLVIPCY